MAVRLGGGLFQLGPVKDYVKMLSENADVKFIVFAHHRVMLDSITEQLVNDNVTFIRIDGSTLAVDRPVSYCRQLIGSCLQCFETVGWAAGRASGL